MMSTMRYHVEDLVRIREGEFELGDLKEWEIEAVS
jgi:16S rRNA U516 pseudouridylate synthase RsuA-like enzyme